MEYKTLGCYLIVKNEEDKISGCLRVLSRVCDEIVVVDTGSEDKTVEYASKFARVEHFTWIDDFSAARNYAKSLMTSDYVFSIDADEYLTSALVKKINLLKMVRRPCCYLAKMLSIFMELSYKAIKKIKFYN